MTRDVHAYFDEVVEPHIASRLPQVAAEMIVQVHGSYGLGLGDKRSDLDAIIYLDDPLWREQGGQVQLLMQHDLPPFAAPSPAYCETPGDPFSWPIFGHSEINVHPVSWLLDHQAQDFLGDAGEPSWEKVSQPSLYELQHNLILRDPRGLMARLQRLASPERLPDWLWRKLLIERLCDLKGEPWELAKALARGRAAEARIVLGSLVQSLLELGFLISRRYYPYRKYLWPAFAALPLARACLADFELLVSATESAAQAEAMQRITRRYTERILADGLLSAAVLEDLFAARNGRAWNNPRWDEGKIRLQEAAVAAGYESRDGWIWGLWGWT